MELSSILEIVVQVHATPEHTQGSICLIDSQENIAIVGDTIIYRLLLMATQRIFAQASVVACKFSV